MGKTLIFSDVDYSVNAIANSDIVDDISYDNAQLKAMITPSATGKYVNSSGGISSSGDLAYIVIDVSRYSSIIISGYNGTTVGGFFSSSVINSSNHISAVTRSSAGSYTNRTVAIPDGATHFAWNLNNNYNTYAASLIV